MRAKQKIMPMMRREARAARDLVLAPGGPGKWLGRVVKLGFEQHTDPLIGKEWMWVEVRAVRGDTLVGVLLNRPRYATHLKLGDRVVLAESEIVALDTPRRGY